MPAHKTSRSELRDQARAGDVKAAFELIDRAHITTLKGLLANVCTWDCELTPEIFDCCCDAFDLWVERERLRLS